MFSRTGLLWRLLSMGMVATGVIVMLSVVLLAMPDSDEVFETQIGSGMEPTIDSGTSVDVRVVSPEQIGRGNVVVFHPGGWVSPNSIGTDMVLVRRVVGIGGDTVVCCDPQGRSTVNGKAITEDYVMRPEMDPEPNGDENFREFSMTLPPDQLWMLGDFRSASADSRARTDLPGKGAVPVADVEGIVVSVNGEDLVAVKAFTEAGLPGAPYEDTLRIVMAGGGVLFFGGIVWLIAALRSRDKAEV